ncbi:hypothetical protein Tco_0496675 [Tanacetum coccineum]
MMVTQELAAKAMDDVSRQAFEEERGRKLHLKRRLLQIPVLTNLVLIGHLSNTPNVSAASTSTGANADESSFFYLGGKIPIDASTLPNADLPIDQNMNVLEYTFDTLPNDGIFNETYDDDEDVGAEADFNNMDNTIALQTRGKIQKAIFAHNKPWKPKTISQPFKLKSWVDAIARGIASVQTTEELLYGEKGSPFELRRFTQDSDYRGDSLDRKINLTCGCHFLEEDGYLAMQEADILGKIINLRQNMLKLLIVLWRISMDLRMDRSCAANSSYTWSVSTKSKLQLVDATGIYNLSDAEIYAGLATLRGYAGDFVPLMPAMLADAAMEPGCLARSQNPTDKGKRYRRRARSVAKNINTGLDADRRDELLLVEEEILNWYLKKREQMDADTVYMSFGAMGKTFQERIYRLYRALCLIHTLNEDAIWKLST